ncbi:MAG: NAD-dependent malic enzyme [Gemmatimonadales bacterium]
MSDKNRKLASGVVPKGVAILHDPRFNKGTAFTPAERQALELQGLLPPRVFNQEEQQVRILKAYRSQDSDLGKYIYLIALQDRNETLFYRTVMDNIEEMLPIIYTPTVGEACKQFGHIFRRPRGLYLTHADRGSIADVLGNWHEPEVAVIVVTDGERILGLGDLGAQGMGIPVGKLSLYTALAGIHPSLCLPITLDVGTNNAELLNDPLYIGHPHERITGVEYDEFLDEFVTAVQQLFPDAILQFEDFATHNAVRLLERYRSRVRTFNDDIQGTAAMALAGLAAAGRVTGADLQSQKTLFFGAGSAATGIGNLIVARLVALGMNEADARKRCWFVDSKGLVVASRGDLASHKKPFAHDFEFVRDLEGAIRALEPTALVGVSGQGQAFTHPVVDAMAQLNDRPIILALSNPTSKSECTAEQAYQWSGGRAIFASGSPFEPVEYEGRKYVPGQGNNAYIFPGVGLGVIAARARFITDEMFAAAAVSLASMVTDETLEQGSLYPPLTTIRDVSVGIAVAVAEEVLGAGLSAAARPADLEAHVRSLMYEPDYPDYA